MTRTLCVDLVGGTFRTTLAIRPEQHHFIKILGDAKMLKPFAMADAKARSTARKGQQRSLWAVGSITDKKAPAPRLKDVPDSFVSIASMWERKTARITVEEIGALKAVAGRLAAVIELRLSAHYREMKKAALQHPSDVAAYLVLREVDEKACAEVPRLRLRALDFGVKALLEK